MPQQTSAGEASASGAPNSSTKRKQAGNDWVRKRVSQACDQCRNKKLKCDGVRPICSTCVSLGRDCGYGSVVKKRGLPEGYVRGLERLLGLSLSGNGGFGSVITAFESSLTDDTTKADLMRQWNGDDIVSGETLPEIWRNSTLCKNFEQLLPSLDATDSAGQEAKKPRLEPHSVDFGSSKSVGKSETDSLELPAREDAEELFHIYFMYTHCWLPIVAKDEILASYYRTLELPESTLPMGEHAALWAVFACAENQRLHPSQGRNEVAFIIQSPKAKSYYEKARSLVPSEDSDLGVGHIQALLLLSLVKLAVGQLRAAWLLVSQAINIAIDTGDARFTTSSSHISGGIRQHVFLGCFCLDTLIASCLGRRPRLDRRDVLNACFLDENGLEEWGHLLLGNCFENERPGPSRSLSTFNHFVRLVCILNGVAHELDKGEPSSQIVCKVRNELGDWKSSLPSYCASVTSMDDVSRMTSTHPHQLNLHATFLLCEEILRRKFDINTVKSIGRDFNLIALPPPARNSLGSISFPSAVYLLASIHKDTSGMNPVLDTSPILSIPSPTKFNADNVPDSKEILSTPFDDQTLGTSKLDRHKLEIGSILATAPTSGSVGARFDSEINYFRNHSHGDISMADRTVSRQLRHKNAADRTMLGNPGSWNNSNGPSQYALNHSTSVQGNVDISPTWFTEDTDTYNAAGDLFHFAQSSRATKIPSEIGGLHANSISESTQSGIEVLALDPIFQSIGGTDDFFCEISNLDHFAGDRDETYRNLGFLLPSEIQDPFGIQNQPGEPSTDYQAGGYAPGE